jgi:hypothetical protein
VESSKEVLGPEWGVGDRVKADWVSAGPAQARARNNVNTSRRVRGDLPNIALYERIADATALYPGGHRRPKGHLEDGKSGSLPSLRSVACIWSLNTFTIGWAERLESARRRRTTGKISQQVDPDIRPGGQPHNRDADRDRWVEGSAGNVADRKRPHQHREPDRQPVERIARRALGRSDVQYDVNERKGEKKFCQKCGYRCRVEWCNNAPTL